jgi:hypothetical protein
MYSECLPKSRSLLCLYLHRQFGGASVCCIVSFDVGLGGAGMLFWRCLGHHPVVVAGGVLRGVCDCRVAAGGSMAADCKPGAEFVLIACAVSALCSVWNQHAVGLLASCIDARVLLR